MMSEVRVWIDVDNPPQVQYLLPFQDAFLSAGAQVLVTARAYGKTAELIGLRGGRAHVVGRGYGRSKPSKVIGTLLRARRLSQVCRAWGRPTAVVSSSRAAALASWYMGLRQTAIIDYEYVNLAVYRRSGCALAFPDVIPSAFFADRGFHPSRLVPFPGLKEDISFSSIEVSHVATSSVRSDGLTRLLVRPPSEGSHYYHRDSGVLTRQLLAFLAPRSDTVVKLAPRNGNQPRYLTGLDWANQPEVLDEATPFPDVLANADGVISAGGTMIREAAYLGIPAFSIFSGPTGAVDRYLEGTGRLVFIRRPEDFDMLQPSALHRKPAMEKRPDFVSALAATILERVAMA